jgi:hypothetical protein
LFSTATHQDQHSAGEVEGRAQATRQSSKTEKT